MGAGIVGVAAGAAGAALAVGDDGGVRDRVGGGTGAVERDGDGTAGAAGAAAAAIAADAGLVGTTGTTRAAGAAGDHQRAAIGGGGGDVGRDGRGHGGTGRALAATIGLVAAEAVEAGVRSLGSGAGRGLLVDIIIGRPGRDLGIAGKCRPGRDHSSRDQASRDAETEEGPDGRHVPAIQEGTRLRHRSCLSCRRPGGQCRRRSGLSSAIARSYRAGL